MSHILDLALIQYADIADIVDGMTKSVDLNGPAECDESATTLWTILVVLKGRGNLGSASEASENILRWLFHRWSPGMYSKRCNRNAEFTPVQQRGVTVVIHCISLSISQHSAL